MAEKVITEPTPGFKSPTYTNKHTRAHSLATQENDNMLLSAKQSPHARTEIGGNFSSMRSTRTHLRTGSTGAGFLQTISSSTLLHASPTWSFPKGDRFTSPRLQTSASSSDLILPGTKSPKSTTFGFAHKFIFPQHILRNARDYPSPDRYNIAENLKNGARGKSFGLSYEYYRKAYVPGTNIVNEQLASQIPHPGKYEVAQDPGVNKKKFSIYQKIRAPEALHSPPCNTYSPRQTLVENKRFSQITFGKGWKYDFTKVSRHARYPGAGTYVLPSPFDKFDKRIKVEKKRQLERRIQMRTSGVDNFF